MSKAQAVRTAKRLSATPLAEQWLSAVRALDEATTGADLGKTFDPSRNYLSLADARTGTVGYFAGDGGYTRFAVREYSDSSGFYLDLVQTGATDNAQAWQSAYKLQHEVCRVLDTFATGAYLGEQTTTAEPFRPVSVLEQFVADLRKHGNGNATAGEAIILMDLACRHHKQAEDQCNGVRAEISSALRLRIQDTAKEVGASGVIFSGDPRGCTVKLRFHDGATNDFGREGWCVPTGEDD